MDAAQREKIVTFSSIAGCDAEFAASFLEANAWELELAVSSFCDSSGSVTAAGIGGLGGGGG
eukprot:CAMPEP_0174736402 /NCGR_PEP_ID=MMETSP1094-20130205/66610_1 /TAXON_ID=156173 /ORGANISM="Chrysochromulina brevifilum, Strain UTEX LB 985" /LENGTH=61 /DNA_ID=CAMNT_0015939491 /DNA_START=30 /DNA_END=211 /DNA_ORIENTATION=-